MSVVEFAFWRRASKTEIKQKIATGLIVSSPKSQSHIMAKQLGHDNLTPVGGKISRSGSRAGASDKLVSTLLSLAKNYDADGLLEVINNHRGRTVEVWYRVIWKEGVNLRCGVETFGCILSEIRGLTVESTIGGVTTDASFWDIFNVSKNEWLQHANGLRDGLRND